MSTATLERSAGWYLAVVLLGACAGPGAARPSGPTSLPPPEPPAAYVLVPVAPQRLVLQAPPPAGAAPLQLPDGRVMAPYAPTDSPLLAPPSH